MSKLIIFDFDGVIVDSVDLYIKVWIKTFNHFNLIFPLVTREQYREKYDSAWEKNYTNYGFTAEQIPKALKVFFSYLSYDQAELYSGIKDSLKTLSADFPLVVLSTTFSKFIENFLTRHDLSHFFKQISGGDGTSAKTARLKNLLDQFGAKPNEAIMIGDTASDIRAGKELGTHTIGMTYGWYAPHRVIAEEPTLYVNSAPLIPKAVNEIFSQQE